MIKRKGFRKVRPAGESLLGSITRRLFSRKRKLQKHSDLDYHRYRIKEWISKHSAILPGLIAIAISIIGLVIIDLQFQPIQTPQEIYSKLQNLNHMQALLIIVLIWVVNLKMHKVPIYR